MGSVLLILASVFYRSALPWKSRIFRKGIGYRWFGGQVKEIMFSLFLIITRWIMLAVQNIHGTLILLVE